MDAGGCWWVDALQELMEPRASVFFGAAAEAFAQVFMARGAGEEAFGEGAEVEAGSAGDDGEMVASADFMECSSGGAAIGSGGVRLVWIGYVDEMMRGLSAFGGGWLGGAEVQAAVDGYGVAGNDFALEGFGEAEGEGGFAAACGAQEEDGEGICAHGRHHPGVQIQDLLA